MTVEAGVKKNAFKQNTSIRYNPCNNNGIIPILIP